MDKIFEGIIDFLKSILVEAIMNYIEIASVIVYGLFGTVADEVGKTPSEFNPVIFNTVQTISEKVLLPIGGIVLTFVMCHELINMIIERNNFHDFPPSEILKWIFKTCIAILILSNVFEFTMAVFDISKYIVEETHGTLSLDTGLSIFPDRDALEDVLMDSSTGALLGMLMEIFILCMVLNFIKLATIVVIYGRMMEIYLVTSLAPIPFATMGSKELSSIGQNYIKSLCALGLQAFLILLCVAIYVSLVASIDTTIIDGGNPFWVVWEVLAYNVMLIMSLFQTSSVAKRVMNAQ